MVGPTPAELARDQAPVPSKYMDAVAVSHYLGVSLTYIRRLTSQRQIPYIRLGRRVVFDKVAVDRWTQRRAIFPRGWAV